MVADLRVRLIDSAVELPVKNEARSDSGSDGYVNQSVLVLAGAPPCLSKSGRIGVIFDRHFHREDFSQVPDRVLAFPLRKEIDIANLARERVHGAASILSRCRRSSYLLSVPLF